MTTEARHDLQLAFDRLRSVPFPRDSALSDELSDLHAELAEYDGHVAGIASSLLGNAPVDASLLRSDDVLQSGLERAASELRGGAQATAEEYLAYFRLLEDVLNAARLCARR